MSTEIVPFNFHGSMLDVVRDGEHVWVGVRPIAEIFGLSAESQRQKLARQPWATTCIMKAVAPDGRNREQSFVDLESLPMWLATIDASRVALDVRPRLAHFQKECARVLRDHFFPRVVAPPPSGAHRVESEIVNGPRIADDPRMRDRLRKMIMGAAAVTGRSHQAIHGALRKGVRPASSIYLASQLHYEKLCDDVLDITDGRWLLPAPRHARLAPVVDLRQTALPFPRNAS